MANFILSPNMSLPVPVPGVDPGPDYANNLNSSLTLIDGHNHSPGSGVQINPAGILINSDLPFNVNNATLLRSVRFQLQGAPLSASTDIGCIYEAGSGGDLYYNDASGNKIQITKSGSVNATTSGIFSGTASASFVAGVLVVDAAALTPANIQVASVLLGNNTSGTQYLTLSPPSAMGSSFTLTLPNIPGVLSSMTLDASGNMGSITFDQVGVNMTSVGANAIGNTRTRPVSTPNSTVAGGVALSPSSGSFSTASTSFVTIPNLQINLVTTGKPVFLGIIPDNSGTAAAITINGGDVVTINIINDTLSYIVGTVEMGAVNAGWPGNFVMIDTNAPAGAFTYAAQMHTRSANSCSIQAVTLIAYEI